MCHVLLYYYHAFVRAAVAQCYYHAIVRAAVAQRTLPVGIPRLLLCCLMTPCYLLVDRDVTEPAEICIRRMWIL